MNKSLCKGAYFKVYGKPREINKDYYEIPFTEYRADGTIYRKGTEDFSSERLQTIEEYYVYRWNEKQMPSGHRYTDCIGRLRVSPNACKIRVARFLYGEVERISKY